MYLNLEVGIFDLCFTAASPSLIFSYNIVPPIELHAITVSFVLS